MPRIIKQNWNFLVTAGICMALAGRLDAARPDWVSVPKVSKRDVFVVGVASHAGSYEEAMEKSWVNGLGVAAKTHFPFLLRIQERTRETLRDAVYQRDIEISLENIKWDGLEEDTAAGSPYFEVADSQSGEKTFTAFRLLKWSRAGMVRERQRLQSLAQKSDPESGATYSTVMGRRGVATGSLKVTSDPPGATLLLNGEFIGRSNADFTSVGGGVYQLAATLPGHDLVEKEITIVGGRHEDVAIKFEISKGRVIITSTPEKALVYIDKIPGGRRTPLELSLEEGAHDVLVEMPGHYPERRTIVIASHRKTEIAIELTPKPGRISVLTRPSGAEVFVDGESIGHSDIINQLTLGGTHTVRIEKNGFSTVTQTVEISELHGQSLVVNLTEAVPASATSVSKYRRTASSGETTSSWSGTFWMIVGGAMLISGINEALISAPGPDTESYECNSASGSYYRGSRCEWITKPADYDEARYDRGAFMALAGGLISTIGIVIKHEESMNRPDK